MSCEIYMSLQESYIPDNSAKFELRIDSKIAFSTHKKDNLPQYMK